MTSLLVVAVLFPLLLGCAFLLGRYLRDRLQDGPELSSVTRQHLELYQGGQLNEAAVEAAKRRYESWLRAGEVERIEATLRAGTQFVVRVRALAELGTEEAARILERQLRRRLSRDQLEQAWYRIDVAHSLRNLDRDDCLPALLESFAEVDEPPLAHYYAAVVVTFFEFGSYTQPADTTAGRSALRVLHRALEGLRYGVTPRVVVEGRLGEVVERLWDEGCDPADPLPARVFLEARRLLRRAAAVEPFLEDEPFEQEAFRLQISRLESLESALADYLDEAGPHIARSLPALAGESQRDALLALDDLRFDAAQVLLPLLEQPGFRHPEAAVRALAWSKDPAVGPFLRSWVERNRPVALRGLPARRWPRRAAAVPGVPYEAVLSTLRHHPSVETERFLLTAAGGADPGYRAAAIGSLGWWEPHERAEVLFQLQDARFDPAAEVRHAARAALARLGERQALQWFRQALASDNAARAAEAVRAVLQEGLTLLWPELDRLADAEDFELAYVAREALEQMQEDLDRRLRR